MTMHYKNSDDIKRKLRELKRFEIGLRTGNYNTPNKNIIINKDKTLLFDKNGNALIWDKFFHLKDTINKQAKYSLEDLSTMSKEEFTDIINEYFYQVYYMHYKEKGFTSDSLIDGDILSELGLPLNSSYDDVISSVREHVKAYHPDNGGDVGKFIEIMNIYKQFRADTQE